MKFTSNKTSLQSNIYIHIRRVVARGREQENVNLMTVKLIQIVTLRSRRRVASLLSRYILNVDKI